MKIITKERILKALENSLRHYSAKPETHVVETMAQIGIKAVCAEVFEQKAEITDKERLELVYQGFNDPEKIFKRLSHWSASRSLDSASALKEAWLGSWQRALEQKWARDERIYVIQRKYGISGLNEAEIDYGNQIIKYHEPSWELELLDSDLEVMKRERNMLADAFVSACAFHEMKLYERTDSSSSKDDWIEVRPNRVLGLANIYQWTKVWKHKRYINYKELDSQGCTTPLGEPATPDHEMEYEFHLVVGSGEPDDSKDSVWFCARLGRGKPSL